MSYNRCKVKIEGVRTETTNTEERKSYATELEDGERDHELRNAGGLKEWKDKEIDSPLELTEGTGSC